jgi:hypothetical protein
MLTPTYLSIYLHILTLCFPNKHHASSY